MKSRSFSVYQFLQKRTFKARVNSEPALQVPWKVKTGFDYSDSEPIKNWEQAVAYVLLYIKYILLFINIV